MIDGAGSGLSPERAAQLVAQVAAGLAAAHRRDLIHRDVKPANVLIDAGGEREHAYLTDFGIARHSSATSGLTHTGALIGTMDYLAPERIQDQGGDGRADVYALGCVLFEALTGARPYERDNDVAKMYAHLSAPVPSARELRPDLPPELDELAQRAMAKDPDDRFASAGEMSEALTDTLPSRPDHRAEPSAAADRARRAGGGGRGRAERAGDRAGPAGAQRPRHAAGPDRAGRPAPSAPGTEPAPAAPVAGEPAELAATEAAVEAEATHRRAARTRPAGHSASRGEAVPAHRARAHPRRAGAGGRAAGHPAAGRSRHAAAHRSRRAAKAQGAGGGHRRRAGGRGRRGDRARARRRRRRPRGRDGHERHQQETTGEQTTQDTTEEDAPLAFRQTANIPVPGDGADGMAVGEGAVWLADKNSDQVIPIGVNAKQAGTPIDVGDEPDSVAVGFGSVWVSNTSGGTVSRIDPESMSQADRDPGRRGAGGHRRVGRGDLGGQLRGRQRHAHLAQGRPRADRAGGRRPGAAGGGRRRRHLGHAGGGQQGGGARSRDRHADRQGDRGERPAARHRVRRRPRLGVVAPGGEAHDLRPEDPAGTEEELEVPAGPREIRYGLGAIWLNSSTDGVLTAIDPETLEVVEQFNPGKENYGLAVNNRFAWSASLQEQRVLKVAPG